MIVVASALSRLEHAQGGHKDLDMGTRVGKISFDMGASMGDDAVSGRVP
jgi:hypothetical protein